jgi:hypothetical protein
MNTFTYGHSPGDGSEDIWSSLDHDNNSYVYNTSCWLYGARGVPDQSRGLTALSPYNNGGGVQQGAGTLITPRHFITKDDWGPIPAGVVFRFIGKDNTSYPVTHICGKQITPNTPYWIGLIWPQPPTTNVAYVRVLPDALQRKLTYPTHLYDPLQDVDPPCWQSQNVPAVGTSQWKDAYITDLCYLRDEDFVADFLHSKWFPDWGSHYYKDPNNRATCYPRNDQTGGDCGHPAFLLINGELVLIGPWTYCGVAIWPGGFLDEINTAISTLDNWAYTSNNIPVSGYTVTPYDLSAFPNLW